MELIALWYLLIAVFASRVSVTARMAWPDAPRIVRGLWLLAFAVLWPVWMGLAGILTIIGDARRPQEER